jgi:integrase
MVEVEDWLKNLHVVGRHPKPGKQRLVSPLYRSQVKNIFHLAIEKAILWGALPMQRNPVELVKLKGSGQRAKDLVILTLPQYQQFLDDPELPEVVRVMVQLAAGLGLRVSEILGLKWSDLDFDAKTVKVQRSVVNGQANDTKTDSSKAALPLHDSLIDVLRWWHPRAVKSPWVFCSERTGRPYDRDWLRAQYLQPAGERIGVQGLGWHGFRHFYRSMLRATGASLEDQKGLMRHSRIATTIDVYGGDDNADRLRPMNQKIIEMMPRRSA